MGFHGQLGFTRKCPVACTNNLITHHASHPFFRICSRGVAAESESVRSPLNARQLEHPGPNSSTPSGLRGPEVFAILDRFRTQQHDHLSSVLEGVAALLRRRRAKTFSDSIARLADQVGLTGITTHSFQRMAASTHGCRVERRLGGRPHGQHDPRDAFPHGYVPHGHS